MTQYIAPAMQATTHESCIYIVIHEVKINMHISVGLHPVLMHNNSSGYALAMCPNAYYVTTPNPHFYASCIGKEKYANIHDMLKNLHGGNARGKS
jgi:hypothetical protein